MHLISVREAQSGFPVKKVNLSVATGMKVIREAKALLYTLESLDTSVANSRLDCFIDKNKHPRIQLFLRLWNLFSNFPSVPIWLFQPFSSPPLTIQPIAHRAPCPISTADLAQWLRCSSNKYTDLILWTHLPSHQMSSAIRMANLFVFLPHFQTQVVLV